MINNVLNYKSSWVDFQSELEVNQSKLRIRYYILISISHDFQSLLCSFGRDTFVAAVDDVCVGVLQLAQGRGVIQRGGKHLRITENKAIKKR